MPNAPVVELTLLVAMEGNVVDVSAPHRLVGGERECLLQAFSGLNAPPKNTEVSVDVWFTRDAEAASAHAQPTNVAPPAGATATDAAAPVRAWLDGQRDAILACAERATVLVTARWDASGTATVALGGDLASTPTEGCVRSVVGTHHVPAGAAGEVRHLVR